MASYGTARYRRVLYAAAQTVARYGAAVYGRFKYQKAA